MEQIKKHGLNWEVKRLRESQLKKVRWKESLIFGPWKGP